MAGWDDLNKSAGGATPAFEPGKPVAPIKSWDAANSQAAKQIAALPLVKAAPLNDGTGPARAPATVPLPPGPKQGFLTVLGRSIFGLGKENLITSLAQGEKFGAGLLQKAADLKLLRGMDPTGLQSFILSKVFTPAIEMMSDSVIADSKQRVAENPQWLAPDYFSKNKGVQGVVDNLKQNPGEYTAYVVGTNLPQFAAQLGVAAMTGGVGALVSIGLIEGGETYEDALQHGVSKDAALSLGVVKGSINAALEKAGLDTILGKTGASKIVDGIANKMLRALAHGGVSLLTESGTEAAQEVVGNAVAMTFDENRELLDNVPEAAFAGGILGGPAGFVFSPFHAESSPEAIGRGPTDMGRPPERELPLAGPRRPLPGEAPAAPIVSRETPGAPAILPAPSAPSAGVPAPGSLAPLPGGSTAPTLTALPSRVFAVPASQARGSLIEQMRGTAPITGPQARFQRAIDSETFRRLNVPPDTSAPAIGSVFELDGRLFIVRDVDTDGTVIGFLAPIDGTSSLDLVSTPQSALAASNLDVEAVRQAIVASGIPAGIRRSEQFVTREDALRTVRRYFTEQELPVRFVERISTPEGAAAFGRYTPGMIELVNAPHRTTAPHEAVHAYLDLFYEAGEREAVYQAARQQMGERGAGLSDMDVEEWVADRFARYAATRGGVKGKVREFFDRVLSALRRMFKRTNPDRVEQLFRDITERRRPAVPPARLSVQEQYFQEPEKLTAKLFTMPELQDRVTASRQFLSDLIKSGKANLKQAERILVEQVLNEQFKPSEGPAFRVSPEFASAIDLIDEVNRRSTFAEEDEDGDYPDAPTDEEIKEAKALADKHGLVLGGMMENEGLDITMKPGATIGQAQEAFAALINRRARVTGGRYVARTNADGTITLYHGTRAESAESILKGGFNEHAYFSPTPERDAGGVGGAAEYGPSILQARIDPRGLMFNGLGELVVEDPKHIHWVKPHDADPLSGGEVAAQAKEMGSDQGGLSDFTLDRIRAEDYSRVTMRVEAILEMDPDFDEYVKGSQKARKFKKSKVQMPPILTSDGEVLDGYNRIHQAILDGRETVEVLLGNQKRALSGKDTIDIQAFKDAVHRELLPLSVNVVEETDDMGDAMELDSLTARYKGIVLPADQRGDVVTYAEHVFESPIKTSAGQIHFSTHPSADKYFAHARIEDMADGTTRRLIEVQSDLFQRGRLEGEVKVAQSGDGKWGVVDQKTKVFDAQFDTEAEARASTGIAKLEPYRQTWWQRVIREEIRRAAVDGKKVLRLPTGETAMKVEGLGGFGSEGTTWSIVNEAGWIVRRILSTTWDKDLVVGRELRQGLGDRWVITEVLGDGRFKAVPKSQIYNTPTTSAGGALDFLDEGRYYRESSQETFDISGKVDKDNPIFRFYERDVVPYILKSRRGNARMMTDGQGVSWVETAITTEDLAPVLAYQRADQVPDDFYDDMEKEGLVPSPDASLEAQESVAAFEVEKELGFIPKPGQIPPSHAAYLEERRHEAVARYKENLAREDYEEEVMREANAALLEEGLVFGDSEMELGYQRFKKLAKRHKWMMDPGIERDVITQRLNGKAALEDTGNYKFTNRNDVGQTLFERDNQSGLYDDDVIAAYQERIRLEEELVEKVATKTSKELREAAERMGARLIRSATVQKKVNVERVVKAIYQRKKRKVSTTITGDEMTLLRRRLRDMAKISRAGYKAGAKDAKRFVKDELMAKYRQSETDRIEVVNQLHDYLVENLPSSQRGRFTKALAKLKSSGNAKAALKIMDQIDRVQERWEKGEAVADFKEAVKRFRKGAPAIALDYQERIMAVLRSYEASKPTANTMRQLNALASFIEQNPDAYVPASVTSQLKRLARVPLADLTASQVEEVNALVSELTRLGRLKQDLKNVYDEREWQKNVDALVAGTRNRDPEDGAGKRYKDAAIAANDTFVSPARVFDAMDGYAHYKGANVLLYRKLRDASQQSEIISSDIALSFLEGMERLGIKSLDEEQQRAIYLHSALEQGNMGSVATTMIKHGLAEKPRIMDQAGIEEVVSKLRPLTPKERELLDLARATVARQTDDFAATYEEKHNLRFPRVEDNYLPFRYADDNPTSAEDFVLDERMLKRSVEPGSVKERVEGVRRELRTDFINVVMEAIESQSKYIYLEPAMMDVSALVKSKEYREAAGAHNSDYWANQLDIAARDGASANAIKMRWIDPFVRKLRFNVSAAILGARLTTVALQPFTLFHAYGMLSMEHGVGTANTLIQEVAKTFLNPRYAKAVVEQSPALILRSGGDATVRELSERLGADTADGIIEKARNGMIDFALKPMKWADLRTAAAANQSFYRVLRAKGLSDADARSEADFYADLVASSSQIMDKPHIFSRGEGARMFTMFLSFAFNEWSYVSHDIVKGGLIKGDYQAKYRAAFALMLVFASKMLEQVARDAIRDLLKPEDKEKDLPSPQVMATVSIVSVFPFFGPAVAAAANGFSSDIAGSPLLSAMEDIIEGFSAVTTGKKDTTKQRGAIKVAKSLSLVSGVPILPIVLDMAKDWMIE